MISHVVLMTPKPDLSPEERRTFIDTFERAVTRIPAVKGVRIGTRVRHGAQYEQITPPNGDFLAVIDFDDLAGLQAYLQHPEHQVLGRLFYELLSAAWVYDFKVSGIELLRDLR